MVPRAEIAHWLAASILLLLGLIVLSEAIVGTEVFRRRPWRAYLWPALALAGGVGLWVVAIFSTFSTMHLLAHAVWAQVDDDRRRRAARCGSREADEPSLVVGQRSSLARLRDRVPDP